MNILLGTAVIIFISISIMFLWLIRKQKNRMEQYETLNIKGAVRGHLGMFCPPSVVDANRAKLFKRGAKF